MANSISLSLCMIVKNEQKHLRKCLDSVNSIVDEIILTDTGSTDATINIAAEFNAQIFSFKWINDFSAARNFALSKASGRWILYLDADEELSESSLYELSEIIKVNERKGVKCTVNSINTLGGKSNRMTYTRLFYNSPGIKFEGKVHEQIDNSLIKEGYKFAGSGIEIIHHGYNLADDELKEKAARNLDMLISEYKQTGSSYYAYQLANTYSVLEDYNSAIKYYNESLKDESLYNEYKCVAYLNLADAELRNHNLILASDYVNRGITADKNNPMIYLLASQVNLRQKKYDEALKYSSLALEVNNSNISGSVLKIRMNEYAIVFQSLLICVLENDENKFIGFLERLSSDDLLYTFLKCLYMGEPFEIKKFRNLVNQDNLLLILTLIEKYQDNNFILDFLLSIKFRFSDNAKYLCQLGKAYMESNLYYEAALVLENSLLLKLKDPVAIFYLVSAYLMINKSDRVIEIIKFGEAEFGSIPEFMNQLNKLKEKIKPLVNSKEKEIN